MPVSHTAERFTPAGRGLHGKALAAWPSQDHARIQVDDLLIIIYQQNTAHRLLQALDGPHQITVGDRLHQDPGDAARLVYPRLAGDDAADQGRIAYGLAQGVDTLLNLFQRLAVYSTGWPANLSHPELTGDAFEREKSNRSL